MLQTTLNDLFHKLYIFGLLYTYKNIYIQTIPIYIKIHRPIDLKSRDYDQHMYNTNIQFSSAFFFVTECTGTEFRHLFFNGFSKL
jgi:hypothetical protein